MNECNVFLQFRFDFGTNKWTEAASMSVCREYAAHVVLSGLLYVMGGRGQNLQSGYHNSVELFDPLLDEWKTVAPMLHRRTRATASVCHGFIFVLGGLSSGYEGDLQSIEKYDPLQNSWTEVSKTC